MADRDTSLKDMNHPTQVNGSQVNMHTLEKNVVGKVKNEMDSVVTTVQTRLKDTVMTAVENLVIPRVELAKN